MQTGALDEPLPASASCAGASSARVHAAMTDTNTSATTLRVRVEIMSEKIRVLFVCHGNICRSPLAEGVFRRLVQDAGVAHRFEIDSAGTSGYHEGDAPDPRTVAEAATRGLKLDHSARRMMPKDFDRFDYVLVMDAENKAAVDQLRQRSTGAAIVRLLRSYDKTAGPALDVPDPYYGGPRGFADVHDMVDRACRGFLDVITSASSREGA
jgi:protein-tyrosine phosphatase